MVKKSNSETRGESKPPSDVELVNLLGGSYAAFEALTRGYPGVTCQWRRYGKKSPWVLKVNQCDRTLVYIIPKSGQFEVTVVLGERVVEAALAGRVNESLHESIRSAKKYVEGRSIRVVVSSEADVASVKELVAVKLKPEEV
jgi:hypothetical protein